MKTFALLVLLIAGLLGFVACYDMTPLPNGPPGSNPSDYPILHTAKRCGADAGTCDGGSDR
jgi:hypothetical protein